MTVSRRAVLLSAPATVLLPGLAAAQPATQPGAQPGAAAGGMSKDPLLAPCLLIGGRKQIENCTYALKKLQNDECKAFAKAEIEEHQTIAKNLKGFGFDYPVTAAGGASAQPGQPTAWVVTAGTTKLPVEAAALVAVDHEVAEQCIVNYRTMMEKLEGREFDKRFIGNQLDEHVALLDKVQVFQRHASPKMREVLATGQKTIEQHIATCKQIMATLDKGGRE